MDTFFKFLLVLTSLTFQVIQASIAQQPHRLWSYAQYSYSTSGTRQLRDTGRFYYSGTRGLAFDTTLEYFFYRLPSFQVSISPDDYPDLNPWYTHRYQIVAPRLLAQFDSLSVLRYQPMSSPTFQPVYDVTRRHTGNRLDTLRIKHTGTGPSFLYGFSYNQSGNPDTCRISASQMITLTRDGAGHVIRKNGEYLSGNVIPSRTFYQYNAQGMIDTVVHGDSVGGSFVIHYRDVLEYDGLGRLHKVRHDGTNAASYYQFSNLDSFIYDGLSNRCTDIYQSFNGDTTPAYHNIYAYDTDGRLIGHYYARGAITRTFERNAAGFISQMTETRPGALAIMKTFYYYDSLGAAGVNEATTPAPQIEIYPNPASDKIFLQSAKPISAYRLCSITGQEVRSGGLDGTQKSISVEGLPPGAYVLHVQHQDGSRQMARVMKR